MVGNDLTRFIIVIALLAAVVAWSIWRGIKQDRAHDETDKKHDAEIEALQERLSTLETDQSRYTHGLVKKTNRLEERLAALELSQPSEGTEQL